jgi:RNA polymerase sigma-70 factor, ECF subfamily
VAPNAQTVRVRKLEEHILPYLADLYRAALRLTRRMPDAEDHVQETCQPTFQAFDQIELI